MAVQIRPAARKQAKLRLGIAAPSGAGKTFSALELAFGLGGKVGLIDTENGSGDLYSHLGEYFVIQISAPYSVEKYIEALAAFEAEGFNTVIIDSLSHAWAGEGGLLDQHGKIADRSPTSSSFAAWRQVTPKHNKLVESMLQSTCHIIATMRSKQEYVLESNERGKQVPRKVGMAPIQKEGMEYEFTCMLEIDMQHVAAASKDRTGLFDGQIFKVTQQTGQRLKTWLEAGAEPPKAEIAQAEQADALQITLAAIQSATTMDSLKTLFLQAKRDFAADAAADAEIEKAKNKRKAELSPAPAAASAPAPVAVAA